ncbi:unnamed protein product, partial [Vitis vinifera]
MEDVLDEFNTEANLQIVIHGPQASTSKVHKLIPTCFAACHPTSVKFTAKIGEKIEKITRELDAVAKRKHDFHLREGVGGLSFKMEKRLQTTSLVDESSIYGRDAEKEAIIQFLLSEEASRDNDVASIMRTTASSHHLDVLSYEECRLLFAKHAFAHMNTNIRQKLEPIGEKIVRKCRGLPLAAKSLGSLLHTKQDENAWNEVLNNGIWDFQIEQSDILPALYLSYHYLPTNLKRCFAYCSIFPKDYKFEKRNLVLLWMAEGLLGGSKREETIEDYGNMCFDNLLSRSFFQQASDDESIFLMHDLIHDLAQFVSGKFCSSLDDEKKSQISKQTRHSSYVRAEQFELSKKFDPFYEAHNLRTFLPVHSGYQYPRIFLSKKVSDLLLPTLKCLRVLSLPDYHIVELPHSIGTLKHLRYLDLSHTSIRRLPESITNLFNLQTLMLSNCDSLTHLPTKMGKLINLRHLDISGTRLKEMPMGMEGLKRLRTLTAFVVGEDGGAKIKELRDMSHLGGRLCISKLQNVVDAMDVFEANLKGKERLDELVMQWDGEATARDLQKETTVLEKLQPHNNLKELTIEHYCGEKFPNWLSEHSFTNMVYMHLHDCKTCSSLPSLGQLGSLKVLSIMRIDGVQKVGQEFYGNIGSSSFKPFGSLEILRFEEMLEWEEWVCRGVEFPCLKQLYIEKCPKLKKDLPEHLPKLTTLQIRECQQLEIPPILHNLTSLKNLNIRYCESLASFPEMALPPMLERLRIWSCPILESLPEGMMQNNTTLQCLEICCCGSLRSLPRDIDSLKTLSISGSSFTKLEKLHLWNCTNLESLSIRDGLHHVDLTSLRNCKKLKSLPQGMHTLLTSLQDLYISNCPEIDSFPEGGLPTNLSSLYIMNCNKLLACRMEWGLQTLPFLRTLQIAGYEKERFPEERFLPSTLTSLGIRGFPNLKSLDNKGLQHLTSLETLEIWKYVNSFLEGGLPTNLSELHIRNGNKLVANRMEWGLQTLPFLRTLGIEGCEKERFPEERFLPSSLTSLEIRGFPNLKFLDNKGLQHLTSLETLEIWKCGNLKYFPKQGLPPPFLILILMTLLLFSAFISPGMLLKHPTNIIGRERLCAF